MNSEWTKRRAVPIWDANRTVGVGRDSFSEVSEGLVRERDGVEPEGGDGGESSYIDFLVDREGSSA